MDETLEDRLANFRYGLIAPIVSRQDLSRGEVSALLSEIATKHYQIPGSLRTQVGRRTLERYLERYRQGGWEALKPKPRESGARIPPALLQSVIVLKRANPKRSLERIIQLLEENGQAPKGLLKRSTLYDQLRKFEYLPPKAAKHEQYRRYQAARRNQRWQGDVCHLFHLEDPQQPGHKHKVYLIAWMDDYSRKVTAARLYLAERLPMLEDSLKRAILTHGVPEAIYVDNGAIYSSHHLQRICGRLGIALHHSKPYRPAGRGKIERLFRSVRDSFLSELRLFAQKQPLGLDEVNELFAAWLKDEYNNRRHSATKQLPSLRFDTCPQPIRNIDLHTLYDAFLLEEQRKVDKTGVVSLNGTFWEVESELVGQSINLRFDPYDLTRIQVWHENRRYADAVKLTEREHSPKASSATPPTPEPVDNELAELTIFSALGRPNKREGLSYRSQVEEGGTSECTSRTSK